MSKKKKSPEAPPPAATDPVANALANAPIDDEPTTREDATIFDSAAARDRVLIVATNEIGKEAKCGTASATWLGRLLRDAGLLPADGAVRAGLEVVNFDEADALPGDIAYLGGPDFEHALVLEDNGKSLELARLDATGVVRRSTVPAGEVLEVRSIHTLITAAQAAQEAAQAAESHQ